MKRFPIFHVPHDGDCFPPELMRSVCIPHEDFLRYHDTMRDTAVASLVPDRYRTDEHMIRFPVSRLLCDAERFIGPEEIMERYGMGYCYERAYDGVRIKTITPQLLTATKAYYDRHHEKLDRLCMMHDSLLLIDLHSYADELIPGDLLLQGRRTPDVCIGADSVFTPPELIRIVEGCCHKAGLSVAVNYPYVGALVPNAVLSGRFRGDCIAVMLEIHKRVYLDAQGHLDEDAARPLRSLIEEVAIQGCSCFPDSLDA